MRPFHRSRAFPFEVIECKQDGDDGETQATPGSFRGLASVFGNEDLQGEVVDKGAFRKTIKANSGRVRLLKNHDRDQFLGVAVLRETDEGLSVDPGVINVDKQLGADTFSDMRFSLLNKLPMEMSIGFNIIDEKVVDDVIHLRQIDLREVSLVTFAANPEATVIGTLGVAQLAEAVKGMLDESRLGQDQSLRDIRSLKELMVAGFHLLGSADERVSMAGELLALCPDKKVDPDSSKAAVDELSALTASLRA